MPDQNKRALLIEAVIAGGLIAIGIPAGQPLLALATSVGGNWVHSLAERGLQHWRDRWFTDDGVLNNDITKALCDAFVDAVRQVEHDWKKHRHYQYLWHNSPEQAQLTLDTLRTLREDGATLFQQPDQLAQVAQQQQHDRVLSLLDQDESKANESLKSVLAAFLYGHDDEFVIFITEQLGPKWILRFLEILKDPDEEGTRAWRACQLLWQKSLMLSIEQIQRTTAETADAVLWLQAWAQQLKSQPPTQRNSTGQDALDNILHSVRAQLDEMQQTLDKTYITTLDTYNATLDIKATLEQAYPKGVPAEMAPSQGAVEDPLLALFRAHASAIVARLKEHQSQFPRDPQRNYLDFYIDSQGATIPPTKDDTKLPHTDEIWNVLLPSLQRMAPCILVAEFGMGKTWLLEIIQYRLALALLAGDTSTWIPLWVNFRNFVPTSEPPGMAALIKAMLTGAPSSIFERLREQAWIAAIGEQATEKYKDRLIEYFEQGRFLFLFDALDEMPTNGRDKREPVLSNLGELSKYTRKSPIILTCRRSYFRDSSQEQRLHDLGYDVFYLWPWRRENILAYLTKAYGAGILKTEPQTALQKIEETYDLKDISSRAILSAMLVDQWEDFMKGGAVDLPSLYERHIIKAIGSWQGRKSWQLEEYEIYAYMEEIAFLMFKLNSLSISPEELDTYFSEKFKAFQVDRFSKIAESFVRDIKTNSFLLREQDHYTFCHTSIWEHLVARKLARSLRSQDRTAFRVSDRVMQYQSIYGNFLIPMLQHEPDYIELISTLFAQK